MSKSGSISKWLGGLKAGDPSAAQKLWELYFQRLVALARQRLQGTARGLADEEDIALSAFDSFCRAAARSRFPQLNDRTDLWRLLVVLTERKAFHLRRAEQRQKRGGNPGLVKPQAAPDLADVVCEEPTPQFAAEVADECRHLLKKLRDPQLQTIALWRMEGYTTDEIAVRLRCARSTVERRLRMIRTLWRDQNGRS
jgi:DNA-directed RNA polymerase specialized sigma24 family protein